MADMHHEPDSRPNGISEVSLPAIVVAKSYRGEQLTDGTFSVAIELSTFLRDRKEPMATTFHPLPLCLQIRNHSPTGFAWGYEGSGPAQLALALLADALEDVDQALRHYQDFKRAYVAAWPHSWTISANAIRDFVAGRERAARDSFAE